MCVNKKEFDWLLFGVGALTFGLAANELSHYAFSRTLRERIAIRDHGHCQIDGCPKRSVTIHHLVPESLMNKEVGNGGGTYVNFAKEKFDLLNSQLNGNKQEILKSWVSFIKSADNGVALCKVHHNSIHDTRYEQNPLILVPNPDHPIRPASLQLEDIDSFMDYVFTNVVSKGNGHK